MHTVQCVFFECVVSEADWSYKLLLERFSTIESVVRERHIWKVIREDLKSEQSVELYIDSLSLSLSLSPLPAMRTYPQTSASLPT